jgi:ankyrin repeat protein
MPKETQKKKNLNLWTAASVGNLAEVASRLELGDINVNWKNPDAYGESPLIASSRLGHLPVVTALLDAGADVNQVEGGGRTAIYWAAFKGDTEIINLLLDRGADPNIAEQDGYTPLIIAKSKGQYPAMTLLLERGADLNKADNKGRTLLHWASLTGNEKWINILLEKGADINQEDNKGNTAISVAKNEDIRKLLQDYGRRTTGTLDMASSAKGLKKRKTNKGRKTARKTKKRRMKTVNKRR